MNIDVLEKGNWLYDSGYAFGRLDIRIKKAKSLSINFSKFYLPDSSVMFIYNEKGRMITGPITEKENNKEQIWGSAVYKGDILTIEVKVPAQRLQELKLVISNIAFGYKEIFKDKVYGFGQSGSCNINVLCPEGNGWELERNSVALIVQQDGSSLCSGAMVNNTCNNNVPNFLTANHCYNTIPGPQNVSQWRFVFQRLTTNNCRFHDKLQRTLPVFFSFFQWD